MDLENSLMRLEHGSVWNFREKNLQFVEFCFVLLIWPTSELVFGCSQRLHRLFSGLKPLECRFPKILTNFSDRSKNFQIFLTDSWESILKLIIFCKIITFWRNLSIAVFELIIEAVMFHHRLIEIKLALKLTHEFVPIFGAKKDVSKIILRGNRWKTKGTRTRPPCQNL